MQVRSAFASCASASCCACRKAQAGVFSLFLVWRTTLIFVRFAEACSCSCCSTANAKSRSQGRPTPSPRRTFCPFALEIILSFSGTGQETSRRLHLRRSSAEEDRSSRQRRPLESRFRQTQRAAQVQVLAGGRRGARGGDPPSCCRCWTGRLELEAEARGGYESL